MATQYTTNARIPYPAIGDGSYASLLQNFALVMDAVNAIGQLAVSTTESPSTTLNVKVAAGLFRNAAGTVVSYAGTASQALTNTATNYVYLTNSGTLTISTSAFPTSTDIVTLATVTAAGGVITGITDSRVSYFTAQR